MGGDFAPHNVIAGAVDAMQQAGNRIELLLVGPESVLREKLAAHPQGKWRYTIVDAPDVIEMHESATANIRQKKNTSINIGITLHKEGKADAFVSAGHSGAVMSTSTLVLGRIQGISRPTIGAFFPSIRGVCLLLDAGANVDCKPQHLYEFALMGSIYSRLMFQVENPTVGLLNIGEEDSKGNEAAKEACQLLKKSKLNFIGNVEGNDILQGKANVAVCDGFVGNIILKFGESVPTFFKSTLRQLADKSFYAKLAGLVMRPTLRKALKSMDYEEYGGVPILGVNGVSIIGHGKSTPKAIKNMILQAEEMVLKKINHHIQQALVTAQ